MRRAAKKERNMEEAADLPLSRMNSPPEEEDCGVSGVVSLRVAVLGAVAVLLAVAVLVFTTVELVPVCSVGSVMGRGWPKGYTFRAINTTSVTGEMWRRETEGESNVRSTCAYPGQINERNGVARRRLKDKTNN